MIIYGSRMYFKRNVVQHFAECEHCGNYGKHKSYQARQFGHLYFIPLIPMGEKSQVLNECGACSHGAHIPLTQLPPMVESMKEQFKQCIHRVQDGHREIVPDEESEPVNVGLMIAATIESLYTLQEIKNADSISQILLQQGMKYENEMVLGQWHQVVGNPGQAVQHYQSACALQPDDTIPIWHLSVAERRNGNAAGAITGLKKYLSLEPDDINGLAELAGIYESQSDYDGIVITYDAIYALNTDLLANKEMKKLYKKACRKSGLPGGYLDQL